MVESELDVGSCFTLTLPLTAIVDQATSAVSESDTDLIDGALRQAPDLKAAPEQALDDAQLDTIEDLAVPIRILVAEDNLINQRVVAATLERPARVCEWSRTARCRRGGGRRAIRFGADGL